MDLYMQYAYLSIWVRAIYTLHVYTLISNQTHHPWAQLPLTLCYARWSPCSTVFRLIACSVCIAHKQASMPKALEASVT